MEMEEAVEGLEEEEVSLRVSLNVNCVAKLDMLCYSVTIDLIKVFKGHLNFRTEEWLELT